jgi:DNA-damage-inducible protein J
VTDARLSVRVDAEIKQQADEVFSALGLTMSAGINAFLAQVVARRAIPFQLALGSTDTQPVEVLNERMRDAVRQSLADHAAARQPVALYDPEQQRPYLLHADGTREFVA